MDWTSLVPYAIAALAFLQWPGLWPAVVVVSILSVFRGRAALASGVATIALLTFLFDEGLTRPHIDPANYGYVIFAAAMLAPLLLLPRALWPNPDAPAIEPPGSVRRGARYLLALPLLVAAMFGIDHGLGHILPDPSDSDLNLYSLYLLLPMILAARWAATGTWLLTAPVLARRPRLRRGTAAAVVAALVISQYDDRTMPHALLVATEIAGDTDALADDSTDCATIVAHPDHGTLHFAGHLCHETPERFETVHAAHPQIRRIVIDSPGGRSFSALEIGRRLNELGFEARVDGQCSSACVTVFLGAKQRHVGPDGWLAVHQTSATVWAEGGRQARWPVSADPEIEAFHQDQGASPDLALRASQTPPHDLDLLSNEDLVAYGVARPTTDAPWLPADALPAASAQSDGAPR